MKLKKTFKTQVYCHREVHGLILAVKRDQKVSLSVLPGGRR